MGEIGIDEWKLIDRLKAEGTVQTGLGNDFSAAMRLARTNIVRLEENTEGLSSPLWRLLSSHE